MKPAFFTVQNQTRNTTLATHARKADSFVTRFFGLMGQPGLPEGHGLWLEPCADIHSCFMRFAFDAVFVDKTGKVLHLVEAMKAWRVSKFVKGGRAVLELPAGSIAASQTQIGDVLIVSANESA